MAEAMPEQANPSALRRNSAPAWPVPPRGSGLLGLAAVAGASHAALRWAGGGLVAAPLAAGTFAATAG